MISVTQKYIAQTDGTLLNNELERMWKKIIVDQSEIVYWNVLGWNEDNHKTSVKIGGIPAPRSKSQKLPQSLNISSSLYLANYD